MNTEPNLLPDFAKSYGRRASHNEETTPGVTGETLAGRKCTTWVHRYVFQNGLWRLNHSETLKSIPLNYVEAAKRREKSRAILIKGGIASCHQRAGPTRRNLKKLLVSRVTGHCVCSENIYSGTYYARGNESFVVSTLFNLFIEKNYEKIN